MPNGRINATESQLESASSSSEWWAIGFGGLVIVAVSASFIISFIEPPYATFLFDSLFTEAGTAIGIVGEVGFSIWDSRIQTELRKRSNDKLGAAKKASGEANERAAEAQLALAKFRQSRRSVIAGNEFIIIERLKPFTGTQFDSGISMGGGEIADCWWDLAHIIIAAGWTHLPWRPYGIFAIQHPLMASGQVSATNIEIHIRPDERDRLEPAAKALVSALNDIGIAAADVGFNSHSTNEDAIHIHVGEKR